MQSLTALPYFHELDLRTLRDAVILLDIDGTIAADCENEVSPAVRTAIETLKKQGNSIYLCTNGFKRKHERNRAMAATLGVTYFETTAKKPLRTAAPPDVVHGTKPVVVIGDKFLTDALFAANLGVPFIEVRTLRSAQDPWIVKLAYAIDDPIERLSTPLVRAWHGAAPAGVTILTEPPLPLVPHYARRLKRLLVSFLFFGGVEQRLQRAGFIDDAAAIAHSLSAGFSALHEPVRLNPPLGQLTAHVVVLSGVGTLRAVLEEKRRGFVHTIIAGPCIVTLPSDAENIIKHPLINRVVLPSPWYKRWWLSFDQLFETRAQVIPAGVIDAGPGKDPHGLCIVYSKNVDEKVFHKIIEVLWTHKLPIVVSQYGQFTDGEYRRLLKKAKMVVYLAPYEPHGTALMTAWMADVPTLALSTGKVVYDNKRFDDPDVGAPYLDAESGMAFSSEEDFEIRLLDFLARYDAFTPRAYALAHFTPAIAARAYLNCIQSSENI
jgi:HAD superfamily phosphatase (TIGR01668 family)